MSKKRIWIHIFGSTLVRDVVPSKILIFRKQFTIAIAKIVSTFQPFLNVTLNFIIKKRIFILDKY